MEILNESKCCGTKKAFSCPACQWVQQLTAYNNDQTTTGTKQLTIKVVDWDDGHIPEGFKEQQQQQHFLQPAVVSISSTNTRDASKILSFDDSSDDQGNINCRDDPGCSPSCSAAGCCKTRMVIYDHHSKTENENNDHYLPSPSPPPPSHPVAVHVFDNKLPVTLVDALYEWTVSLDRPWGTYVTLDQVQDYWNQFDDDNGNYNNADKNTNYKNLSQAELALLAVSYYCRHGLTSSCPTFSQRWIGNERNPTQERETPMDDTPNATSIPIVSWSQLCDEAHGVAIWALASPVGSQVPYHLDYAEQIRYDTNVICPPLYAGTLQCSKTELSSSSSSEYDNDDDDDSDQMHDTSPRTAMQGGDFLVNLQGLDHYRQYGYKGALVSKVNNENHNGATDYDADVNDDNIYLDAGLPMNSEKCLSGNCVPSQGGNGWVRIPFSYNRMICHQGDLPHCSTKVKALPPNTMRVMVGFNVFPKIIGERVQQAPEHSNAFRRKVQLQRFWMLQQSKISSTSTTPHDVLTDENCNNNQKVVARQPPNREKVFTLNMIQSNKSLTKLFVLAKRQRIQHLFRQAGAKLELDILQLVWQNQCQEHNDDLSTSSPTITVAYLMKHLGRTQTAACNTDRTGSFSSSSNRPMSLEDQENKLTQQEGNDKGVSDGEYDELRGWPSRLDVQVQVHHMLLKPPNTNSSCNVSCTLLNHDVDYRQLRLVRWQSPSSIENVDHDEKKLLVCPSTLVYVLMEGFV